MNNLTYSTKKRIFSRAGLLSIIASLKVAPMFLRDNQLANAGKTDGIIRMYMDKQGALYPSVDVAMDAGGFINRRFLKSVLKNPDAANLSWYFTSNSKRLELLRQAYQVSASNSPANDFQEVQSKIIAGYVAAIKQAVARQQATMVIFFIHGFNEPYPESENNYPTVRQALLLNPDAARQKPVFVELYWDGLNAKGHNNPFNEARIWPHAVYNSQWIGLALRNFMAKLEEQTPLPLAIITHSLGASVATHALFNIPFKPADIENDTTSIGKIDELMKILTPTAEVRLGMLAPAIPGLPTFINFNKRSPTDIAAAQNNITRIVIGYDPFDFATSKDILKIISLAPYDGATTLGCDYYWSDVRKSDIELVTDSLQTQGYNTDLLLHPVRFDTGVRPGTGGNHEHFMQYYMRDAAQAKLFFEEVFK